ncbi:protein root UVB sensitive 4 isoform X2 [Neltuma alba]|uniref:protein root UVB sensitive 4 isoform X2 n=1 Tax=Neltuma alba TaxID=207710 RepID=UPI0010A2EF94|nr:protein root UVB sensitive 4-like isoform X2 [Prosopis alba]
MGTVYEWDFLIPQQVADSYMDYVRWKFLHRVFSSALQVLATQAMFKAIGVGHSYSLPSSAALNWVLKDGIGRLSRCIYTASLASAFDTNLKRVRFSTSVVFVASIGLELLTPAFPQYFLLLATIANIAKQISLACYLATRSAVLQSFAVADNLGEISAKAQIQTVCFDNLGLLLAALLNMLFESYPRRQVGLHFIIYLIFAGMDLLGIYQGLKHVHLQTLTKDRLEIILNTWIESGYVPTPAEVSEKEGISILGIGGQKSWPIRIGCLNSSNQIAWWSIEAMQRITAEDFYFICVEICSKRLKRIGEPVVLLSLREGAGALHIIMGLLQACSIRRVLIADWSRWESRVGESYESDSAPDDWSMIIEDSKTYAKRDLPCLMEQILEKGWEVKNILLSGTEMIRFTFNCGY